MAREATITQEQVNAAADAIRASGSKPTARAVRDHLGTGSMATVLKLLQVWQAGQVKPAAQDVTLPAQMQRYLVDFVGQEVAAARADLQADLAAAQQAQADLIAEAERQASTINGLTEELDQANSDKAEQAGKLGQMETDLATAREEAIRERQAAEVARTELAKAQLRLEALPRIEAEADRLRAELEIERTARVAAEQSAAVFAARMEEIKAHAASDAKHLADTRSRADRSAEELSDAAYPSSHFNLASRA